MSNEQWCRLVLMKFFPPSTVNNQTYVSPALSKIAGEIWMDWQRVQPLAQSLPTTPNYGSPPGFAWIAQVIMSAAWKKFTADPYAVDLFVKGRIRTKFGSRVQSAVSTGKDIDQI